MKSTKCPAREKNEARKAKTEGRKEGKILLSAHTRTLQANILQLDQKAAKYTACEQLSGKF